MFKYFGTGSALEHKTSSVYYNTDRYYDSTFSYYNWIAAHEYFHTITPLNLHSEKIAKFNFQEADMSRHVWLYEGITDYFAMLLRAQLSGNRSAAGNMAWATSTALKHSKQSMTKSAKNIIRKQNIISWIRKIGHIGNFYEKGKLIALGMDIELMERSNGKRRLLDVILEIKKNYDGTFFQDSALFTVMEKYMYPGFKDYCRKYIEGTDIPPYESYFKKLGWTFYPKNSKLSTYGNFN
ncbi:MAG: hypothetical protein AAGI07_17550 [Bacteroidota bacterium]